MGIYEQLKEYCNCVDVKESDVDELINLISVFTCWTSKPCETFLLGERREVVELPNCLCDCSVFKFEPFYVPFDPDSFTFTLIEQNGTNETAIPIKDLHYSSVDGNFRLGLPLPNCECKPDCGCESEYKLLVEYNAGYERIPECLLPVFCEALVWVKDKNTCDCTECLPCDPTTNEREGVINYASLNGRLQDYFLQVLVTQYHRQLSLMSLCNNKKYLWGVVV